MNLWDPVACSAVFKPLIQDILKILNVRQHRYNPAFPRLRLD